MIWGMESKHLPHIILITFHDIGRHLNCYGVSTVHSPNMDRIAAQGVRLANGFCTAPQCCPSRASIATGRYPHCNGVMGLIHGYSGWDLHPDEVHIAQRLGEAGYHTALVNHQHESRRTPQQLGFVESAMQKGPAGKVGEEAAAFLRGRKDQSMPFYLQVGFTEPHRHGRGKSYGFGYPPDEEHGVWVPPYLVDNAEARVDFAEYQGAIRAADAAVGRICDTLDELGMADNTLLILAADHGIPFPRAKCSLYEPGLEVMTLLRWPGAKWSAAGAAIEPMISNVDYLPTILDLIGRPIPASVQGRSFAALLRGKGESYSPRQEIFGEMTYHDHCDPMRSIRTADHKLIVNFTMAHSFMDPSQSWHRRTITRVPANPAITFHVPVEFYDLRADPLETVNLADNAGYAQVRRELLGRLHRWMVETQDPLLQGIPTPPMHHLAMAALRSGGGE